MGSSTATFSDIFPTEPGATQGVSFARFMEFALYHPEVGYYHRNRTRVELRQDTDFYTASSLGPIFGELVVAGAQQLLGCHWATDFPFVEIGAEPSGGILDGQASSFAQILTIHVGDPLRLPEQAVVFSNELFDAQPFHRMIWRAGAWRETGVAWQNEKLMEVELPEFSSEVAAMQSQLPAAAADGYRLDLPLQATMLLEEILTKPWRGLFLTFDYGKSWQELTEATPQGTARAYSSHYQKNDLLAAPGKQDLTCHVCWDWLSGALHRHGFAKVAVESQESFLVRHAGAALESIVAAEAGSFSARKQAIFQLLHPGNMGQKFQVLNGLRT